MRLHCTVQKILDSMYYLPSIMYVMRCDGAALQDDKYITHCFLLIRWFRPDLHIAGTSICITYFLLIRWRDMINQYI